MPTTTSPRWLVISVAAPPRGQELLLVDALRRLGARAVERAGDRFVAHLPAPRQLDRLLANAERAVRAVTSIRDVALAWEWQTDEAWAAQRARDVEPRRVTDRIVVTAQGREPELDEGDVVIRLVPGVAFGTAEHGTTRGCLRLLERLVEPGQRVSDVGAGSGILSIAAALLGAGHVLALESDPLACATARQNVAANDVGDRVEVRRVEVGPDELRRLSLDGPRGSGRASGPPHVHRPHGFDGIVANIETGVILRLLPAVREALAEGGWLVLSGVPAQDPRVVTHAAGEVGLDLRTELYVDGWWTGLFVRDAAAR